MEGAVFARKTMLIALVLVLGSTSSGFARDDIANFSIREALKSASAREKLDPNIKLSFGHRKQGGAAKPIGSWKSSKTSSLADSPEAACQRSFLTAVISLQRRARGEGGAAVININSYYDNRETSSDATYVCRLGERRAAVALTGTVVRIGK
jgi:hypothetical protein